MAFANLSLLLGVALVAVPIVLHLVLRQQPKQLIFPALQFLKQRREANRRRLQLRHWLLLALRAAAIGALALALARPSVNSAAVGNWAAIAAIGFAWVVIAALLVVVLVQRRGRAIAAALIVGECLLLIPLLLLLVGTLRKDSGIRLGNREAPVSAVLVFDTSPRMLYQYHNQTRLKAAQDIGLWLLQQFPADSEVAVVDAHPGPAVFALDTAAARKAVERLQTTAVAQSMPEVLKSAWRLVSTGKKPRKEVYVLTDLTASAWRAGSASDLRGELAGKRDIALYVLDVGAAKPRNLSLAELALSSQTLARSGELEISTSVRAMGTGGTFSVELRVEEPNADRPVIVNGRPQLPESRVRDRRDARVADNGAESVSFKVSGLPAGVHQGSVVLSSGDGLSADDVRYFAVEVTDAAPVLVVAPATANTSLFTEAIAPYQFRQSKRARFDCTVIEQEELANRTLDSFAAVALLDPRPLPPAVWEKLRTYVTRGGSLAVFLGHFAEPKQFQSETAKLLLGGKLARTWRSPDRRLVLAPQSYDHPILAPYRQRSTSVPWNQSPVFRHWVFEELSPGTQVLIPLSNGRPLLLEHAVEKGRVLVMTTPASDPARPAGREAWNELPTSEDAWPYFVLVNEIMSYLAGAGQRQLNYFTGETAVLANDPEKDPPRYQLFTPSEEPQEISVSDGEVVVSFTERPGAYRLRGNRDGPTTRGFAVNLREDATDLKRTDQAALEGMLGKDRFQLARNREEIKREVGDTRIGREFYPYLIACLALILSLEYLFANRFYQQSASADAGNGTSALTRQSPAGA